MTSGRNRRFLVRFVWTQIAVFFMAATVATYFYGRLPEVAIGWIALIILSLLCLCAVYGASKKIQAGFAFGLTALFVVAPAIWHDGWTVDRSDLLDVAVGTAAFAVWVLAHDARANEPSPLVGHVAGAVTAAMLVLVAAMLASAASTGQLDLLRLMLALAILSAAYELSGPKWKIPLSITALIAMVILVIKAAPGAA